MAPGQFQLETPALGLSLFAHNRRRPALHVMKSEGSDSRITLHSNTSGIWFFCISIWSDERLHQLCQDLHLHCVRKYLWNTVEFCRYTLFPLRREWWVGKFETHLWLPVQRKKVCLDRKRDASEDDGPSCTYLCKCKYSSNHVAMVRFICSIEPQDLIEPLCRSLLNTFFWLHRTLPQKINAVVDPV